MVIKSLYSMKEEEEEEEEEEDFKLCIFYVYTWVSMSSMKYFTHLPLEVAPTTAIMLGELNLTAVLLLAMIGVCLRVCFLLLLKVFESPNIR